MDKARKDFCNKALLMLILAGAILGVVHAGYDESDSIENQDVQSTFAKSSFQRFNKTNSDR